MKVSQEEQPCDHGPSDLMLLSDSRPLHDLVEAEHNGQVDEEEAQQPEGGNEPIFLNADVLILRCD